MDLPAQRHHRSYTLSHSGRGSLLFRRSDLHHLCALSTAKQTNTSPGLPPRIKVTAATQATVGDEMGRYHNDHSLPRLWCCDDIRKWKGSLHGLDSRLGRVLCFATLVRLNAFNLRSRAKFVQEFGISITCGTPNF